MQGNNYDAGPYVPSFGMTWLADRIASLCHVQVKYGKHVYL